jgi:hypothetical protein
MLGRARADLDEHLLVLLYNSMVLRHLQYCLMVWGNFEVDRNKAQGETLLKLQKRFVGLIASKGGRYHADPLFAGYGILKVKVLYWRQLRLHAWKFHNGWCTKPTDLNVFLSSYNSASGRPLQHQGITVHNKHL